MLQMAYIKDALRRIEYEVKKQADKIQRVLMEHEAIKEVLRDTPEDKRLAMVERMRKMREAKAAKNK